MSQVYYTLEQAAEVLKIPPGEVNRMREQNQIRAFRDGSNWKFRKEDVDKTLTDLMRKQNQDEENPIVEDEDDDILTFGMGADDEELPTLMADNADSVVHSAVTEAVNTAAEPVVSLAKDTVEHVHDAVDHVHDAVAETAQNVTDHVKDSLSLAKEDDELSIADDEDDDLNIGLSSDIHQLAGEPGPALEPEHDEDDLVLGGGSDLDLTGGSGLTLGGENEEDSLGLGLADDDELELDEDSDILAIADDEEDSLGLESSLDSDSAALHMIPDDDEQESTDPSFDLVSVDDEDEPDSSSQVISLDKADDSFSDDPFGSGMSDMGDVSDFGGVNDFGPSQAPAADLTSMPAAQPAPTGPASYETNYGSGFLAALCIGFLLLAVSGLMLYDLVRNMWSWGEPYVLTSPIMETIAGLFGAGK